MRADHELLLRNFERLVEHEVELAHRVYELLFRDHPELESLFTGRISPAGIQMVRETLMYAIDRVNGESWVEANLASLGAKHVHYEVTEEMYDWVIEAMLTAMADFSGAEWTAELAASWREQFWHLADLMIAELPA
ncbi:MAG: hypothetical protein GY937_23930 [bacterium]|nr:hypothetical protein [bacterium]